MNRRGFFGLLAGAITAPAVLLKPTLTLLKAIDVHEGWGKKDINYDDFSRADGALSKAWTYNAPSWDTTSEIKSHYMVVYKSRGGAIAECWFDEPLLWKMDDTFEVIVTSPLRLS